LHAPITYFQAIVIGLLQGVTELFPVSSPGHAVLIPSLFGWHNLAAAQSRPESFFLAFLLATLVIVLVGLYKLPDLLGPLGNHVRGQTVVASIVAGFAAYGAVRFLARWFKSHTLWPFGLYCIILGSYCLITLK